KCFNALFKLEAVSGLGNFVFNHPNYAFPEFLENDFNVEGNKVGHPLIPINQMVSNDFNIKTQNHFIILTGSNMAGKSTFLRTLGVNMILAMNGTVVCAAEFKFKPQKLI